jgi:hypothetical protein
MDDVDGLPTTLKDGLEGLFSLRNLMLKEVGRRQRVVTAN